MAKRRILFVEDDVITRTTVADFLDAADMSSTKPTPSCVAAGSHLLHAHSHDRDHDPGVVRFDLPLHRSSRLQRFAHEGIARSELRAKVFGGASIGVMRNGLAARNVAAAADFLSGLGIPVEARDVGGSQGRKLLFRTSDGAAWVRLL